MKIKNNTVSNISIPSLQTRGSAAKRYLIVVGESSLELDDKVWLDEYADNCKLALEAGNLEVTTAPKQSKEQEEKEAADALSAARKLIASADAKSKPVTKPVSPSKVSTNK